MVNDIGPFQNIIEVGWRKGGVEIVFLVDETGSMPESTANTVRGWARNALADGTAKKIGLAAFRDFPISPFGAPDDFVYQRRSILFDKSDETRVFFWRIDPQFGGDLLEAHYDAIIQCAQDEEIGWGVGPRFIVMVTDAVPHNFPTPDGLLPHSTIGQVNATLLATETNVIWVRTDDDQQNWLAPITFNASPNWASIKAAITGVLSA